MPHVFNERDTITARSPDAFEQIGQHVLGDHLGHLVGHAGDRVDHLLHAVRRIDLALQPGRGADRVRDDVAALRHVGLAEVVLGERPAAAAEDGADLLDQLLTPLELDPHDLGDGLAGHVVGRRAEPTAHDHRVGTIEQLADALHHAVEVVAHLAVLVRVDADGGELLADPRAVRVDDLAEQQLGADGEDVTPHVVPCPSSGSGESR